MPSTNQNNSLVCYCIAIIVALTGFTFLSQHEKSIDANETTATTQHRDIQCKIESLIRTITDDPDEFGRSTPSVYELTKIGKPATRQLLQVLEEKDNAEIRWMAVRALKRIYAKQYGFIEGGVGWKSQKHYINFRAFWDSLGNLHVNSTFRECRAAVKKWYKWLDSQGIE
ncbi:MAG: HEAT repeat domain-containing protein [Pirellulales bacterium]|nr:HEAT repeat domain-containing protein [Pirellulales bacterium]